jgi:hypothetical protein
MSSTYDPASGLTCAVVYGSTHKTERAILKRLHSIRIEASHPLLLPGIIVELELTRHTELVEASILDVETKMLIADDLKSYATRSKVTGRAQSRTEAWLDLTYLRNSMITWSTQLLKMIEHIDFLDMEHFPSTTLTLPTPCRCSNDWGSRSPFDPEVSCPLGEASTSSLKTIVKLK